MSKDQEKKPVFLAEELYNKIKERVEATEFNSVEEYVTFVLQEVLKDVEEEKEETFTQEEEEEVKNRLRSLGYLD